MKTIDIFNILIQSGLFSLLLGALIKGVNYSKAWLDAYTLETTTKVKDNNVKNAIILAESCVTTVVTELAQTVAEDLKSKSVDGKLTQEDAAEIKKNAVTKIQDLLSDDVTHTLNTVFGDAETWICSKIEVAVKKMKQTAATTA